MFGDTHATAFIKAFNAAGIYGKTAITHILRHMCVGALVEKGVPATDIARHMRWYSKAISQAVDAYMSTTSVIEPLLVAHGWEGRKEYYCWRESDNIPEQLLCQIFPEIEELKILAEKAYKMSKVDLSAIEFLKTLSMKRRVFLEDAIIMKEMYPSFPTFKHGVFSDPMFETWKQEELMKKKRREDTHFHNNPDLAQVVKHMYEQQQTTFKFIHELKAGPPVPTEPVEAREDAPAGPSNEIAFHRVPTIPSVANIKHGWREWDTSLRPFFSKETKPAWKRTFGETAHAQKNRMDKMQPVFLYMDYIMEKDDSLRADSIITKLQTVMKMFEGVTKTTINESVFINEKMRNLIQGSGNDMEREVLGDAFVAVGLPKPDKTSAEMRQELWGRGNKNKGVKRKRDD